jgi:hypothetical protein
MGQAAAKPIDPSKLTSAAKAKLAATLRARCEFRLDTEIKIAHVLEQIDGIDAELKELATQLGYATKEVFLGKGEVSASPRKAKEFRGDLPEVEEAIWNAMPATKRKALVKEGVIKLVPTWSRADNGRVTTKLFKQASQPAA